MGEMQRGLNSGQSGVINDVHVQTTGNTMGITTCDLIMNLQELDPTQRNGTYPIRLAVMR